MQQHENENEDEMNDDEISKRIFDALEDIEKRLDSLENSREAIWESIGDTGVPK